MRLLIITGLSGSGKTTAARALEDDGFFVVDNLPPALLPPFLSLYAEAGAPPRDLAVVIDARNRDFLAGFDTYLAAIDRQEHRLEILFFDADDETLLRRYSETRRTHPLSERGSVAEGIACERRLLSELRNRATTLIDSTGLTPHQLRAQVIQLIRGEEGGAPFTVHLQSFGFRYGLPPGSDLVFDVRFLPNPHFVPALRPLSGLEPAVRDHVLHQEETREFLRHLEPLLTFLLPRYRHEGKSYLTISVGCTGGRHRSVVLAAHLAELLAQEGVSVSQIHRDIDKGWNA